MTDKSAGFTLIEVIVAMAILAIGLTAIVITINNGVKNSAKIKTRIIANQVAEEAIRDPYRPEKINMLNKSWYITYKQQNTNNNTIKKLTVSVTENPNKKPIVNLTTFQNPNNQ
ncbi:MAG: type II secretion system protein [Gammaproteobacteria bacterium]|nr:type II secretion system protein [Gammaproteobacteria bacterium]